ncbi:MAG: hypothetical protein DRQ47_00300 [Gammaproteobacteria bacterium]|nr:MAG: hypothetical protein DRQ47_00300 [Gammaproteobacteria bacterium]
MAKKLAQILEATDPKFLSLVKTPANRSGFRIIRSDAEAEDGGKFKAKRARRIDSKDGMLFIALPTDFTEEQAMEVMTQFSLEEDYELNMEDGQVRLIRSDLIGEEMPTTVAIRLDDISTAYVSESSFSNTLALRSDSTIGGAVLSGIEFEGHSDRDVEKFLEKHDIPIDEKNIERIDDETFYAPYKEASSNVRPDRVNLADGVNALIYRAETNDVPGNIARGVIEESYGSYGYGQLDFFASLCDEMYTDAAYDAVRTLGDILRQITIYSGLNLSSRIDLMNNALSQYGFYMAELMNSLPRSVVSVMTSDISKTSDKEETTMAGETKKDDATTETEIKRSDDVVADTESKEDDKSSTEDKNETTNKREDDATGDKDSKSADEDKVDDDVLKRSDIAAIVEQAVTAAITAVRKDNTSEAGEVDDKTSDDDDKSESGETAKREDTAITKLAESVESLANKVEELGDTSVVRSDSNGAAGTEEGSVFQGAIFGKK